MQKRNIKSNYMEDKDIVKIFLDTQEWQTFECKRAAIKPADLLEAVVGFANADGGFIVVGLEPKKMNSVTEPELVQKALLLSVKLMRIVLVMEPVKSLKARM